MNEYSILIGGKAGDGIDKAGMIIAYILNRLGYYLYIYRDYPSIIRGGHTFSIIRASKSKVFTHTDSVDVVLAMNKLTAEKHVTYLKPDSVLVYDPATTPELSGLNNNQKTMDMPVSSIIKESGAPHVTSNSIMIGALIKILGIDWDMLEDVFREKMSKMINENLEVARRGYDKAEACFGIQDLKRQALPLLTGNEALGLGLVKGGLNSYIAYPMTPVSNLLHFLAENADNFGLKVIHPESEIGVIMMALGCAYTGERVAVGTSGGGFCLMTEGLSFSAMAELPIVIVLGQRPGPSTGLPTHSCQTELHFAINAGQGEFTRLVVAPGDAEESCYWAPIAIAMAQKFSIPVIILTDKNLAEGTYSFEKELLKTPILSSLPMREANGAYKVNSYTHDENGITTEDPAITKTMQENRLAKAQDLAKELNEYDVVGIYGNKNSSTAIICWGSNKGVCIEAAEQLNLKVVQPVVVSPFPVDQFKKALIGVEKIIAVESNATAQLVRLIKEYGLGADHFVLKYDGRPFSVDELVENLRQIIEGGRA